MQNEILNFIKRRWSIDANWTNGNCFWFAKILQLRFPQLQIYYLPIIGHFITSDGENYYDWNGIYLPEEEPINWEELRNSDFLWAERLIRDCWL